MSAQRFAISRPDGRSNVEVVAELVERSDPGTLLPYRMLEEALSHEGKQFTIRDIHGVVSRGYQRILKVTSRALMPISGVGYRVSEARDHRALADRRKGRADVQLRKGLETLRNVRWNEMDEQSRLAHEGSLMVMTAIWENQQQIDRRISKIEAALAASRARPAEVIPG